MSITRSVALRNGFLTVSLLMMALTHLGCIADGSVRRSANEIAALHSTDLNWSLAAGGDDLNAILDFFTDDAVIYAQGREPVVGKDAIRQFIQESRSQPEFRISWMPKRVGVVGPRDGYTSGSNAITIVGPAGKPIDLTGHYVCLWRKEGDKWRCYLECWNATPVQPK